MKVFLPSLLLLLSNAAANPNTFVHLFEWSHSDVANECETFLSPNDFYAVQVSPPNEHLTGDAWWTRYQPVSYDLVSRSGGHDDFIDMVKRCNAVGVKIIVDVVVNHMAAGDGVGTNNTSYSSRNFPLYGPDDFHHNDNDNTKNCDVSDYTDLNDVQKCDLVGLPDLDTSSPKVQTTISQYLNALLDVGVWGFRMDAAKHQEASLMSAYLDKLTSKPYIFCEVIEGAGEAVTGDMYTDICDVTEFNYALDVAPNIVDGGKMQYLSDVGESWGLLPSASAVIFADNHDTQRGNAPLTYKDGADYDMFNAFMLAHSFGFPKIMSSFYFTDSDAGPPTNGVSNGDNCGEGNDWVCEHRRTSIAPLVAWRVSAGDAEVDNFLSDESGNAISFNRGDGAFIALNNGDDAWTLGVGYKTGLAKGTYDNILGEGRVDVDDNGLSATEIVVDGSTTFALHKGAAGNE